MKLDELTELARDLQAMQAQLAALKQRAVRLGVADTAPLEHARVAVHEVQRRAEARIGAWMVRNDH